MNIIITDITLGSLRQKVRELDALRWLESARNSVEVSELTSEERRELAKTFTPEASLEILRKFNFDKVSHKI